MDLENIGVKELDFASQLDTTGGFAFLLGITVRIVVGASGVTAGYHIAKHQDS